MQSSPMQIVMFWRLPFALFLRIIGSARIPMLLLVAGQAHASIVHNFSYTGASQSFVVPSGVSTITIEAWGAQGWSGSNQGGRGGYAKGDLSVTVGEILAIYVGGQGTAANLAFSPMGGGFNGGGDGQSNFSTTGSAVAGGGGGASDVRQSGISLFDRVIVAGGGGGSTNNGGAFGGAGGGLAGSNGGATVGYPGGTGGTQVAGGSNGGGFGEGGDATVTMIPWNGGGGGGWYGGGVSPAHAGGGGGSSYIGDVSNVLIIGGLQTGNGLVRFTYEVSSIAAVPEPTQLVVWMGLSALGACGAVVQRQRRHP
jgi:hypothetical protein